MDQETWLKEVFGPHRHRLVERDLVRGLDLCLAMYLRDDLTLRPCTTYLSHDELWAALQQLQPLHDPSIARRKNATLAQLSIAWPMAQGKRAGVFIVPIPGAKSRRHIEENVRAAIVLTGEDLADIDRIVPPGAVSGTRYPIGQPQAAAE
jgi:diketogulonate reductase-like aldo/keto reductase